MSTFKIVIPYTPKPKQSVRLVGKRVYSPSAKGMNKTRVYVQNVMQELQIDILKGPLRVIAHFKLPAPKSLTDSRRKVLDQLPHVTRPDVDNLQKFLNDSLNAVLWQDDCKISIVLCTKSVTYDKEGSTSLFIRELDQEPISIDQLLQDVSDNRYNEELLPDCD